MGISKKADPSRKIAKKFDIIAEPFISSSRKIGIKLYLPKEELFLK
jgi:hypothetical protein